uniref:Uncharacterized protein n=1 Tax=Ananas comosus var. bracteatus TaxID=296719 RepID=A0A6V7PF39_ANACO|nr:unnamed protein product [Ananas comosus var. bracteatus]
MGVFTVPREFSPPATPGVGYGFDPTGRTGVFTVSSDIESVVTFTTVEPSSSAAAVDDQDRGKGVARLSFLRENMWRLAEEEAELMPIGFEIAFPSLIEMAKDLDLDVLYDDPALKDIYTRRSLKLQRIPKEVMYKYQQQLSIAWRECLSWIGLVFLSSNAWMAPSCSLLPRQLTRSCKRETRSASTTFNELSKDSTEG